ncbi:tetratricopeptide repeat-containing hybrid sensor histidine kinase/response regulator [Flavobacterium algicola]|uniref:tetratricopeptide repeat-containing hybrid sensor histidine kinase/response regulator n=1 Tax=Flavobacterium algicola TaxID=556529 RepID=UPI001EFDE8B0|nr:ATP-binding protein [Flavobacterium algicola]MCG9792219.1 ATP-binding protein [Flavobacterium algicola]
MKQLLIFFILLSPYIYSQNNNSDGKKDSISYYSNLGNINFEKDNYKEALSYTQKAINYSKKSGSTYDEAVQHYKLGTIYYDVKKYEDALKSFNNSISLFQSQKLSETLASAYYYQGLCYMRKKKLTNAKVSFSKSQSLYNILKITENNDLLNFQKAVIYKLEGKFDLASTIFNTIIVKADSNDLLDTTKAGSLYQIGIIEMLQDRNNLALTYFIKSLNLNEKNKNLEQKSKILLALSKVYEKMLDKNNAYNYLKQHTNLKESISISDNEKLGVDDYENFKENERLKEIAQLNKEKLSQEKTARFTKLINILAVALILILSLLSISLYKNNIIRTRSNELLEEKNKELIKAKDKAEKASRARSEFLSTVSHELRTPLNAINGIAHLLLQEDPKRAQLHYLESLKFSGEYLTTFINDILEINKIESKKIEIERISFNLKQLLKNIQNSLIELAKKNNNKFIFEIDSTIPEDLIGDPTKLSQIFLNLINNALKFTQNGEVIIIAKLIESIDDKVTLYFEITDTGIGINEDKLETVFDSFAQGSVEINRKFGGTGLGLTIVKKLVNLLGSKIKVNSVIGKGTTFLFQLQFDVDTDPIESSENSRIYDDSILKDKRILIVEDNKINQLVSRKMLESKGVICQIIDNGEDAILSLKNNKFDMVLMDVHLPGINGTIATQRIREFDLLTPIIALTAISLNENKEDLMSYGMNDVITKPFVPAEFYNGIAKFL